MREAAEAGDRGDTWDLDLTYLSSGLLMTAIAPVLVLLEVFLALVGSFSLGPLLVLLVVMLVLGAWGFFLVGTAFTRHGCRSLCPGWKRTPVDWVGNGSWVLILLAPLFPVAGFLIMGMLYGLESGNRGSVEVALLFSLGWTLVAALVLVDLHVLLGLVLFAANHGLSRSVRHLRLLISLLGCGLLGWTVGCIWVWWSGRASIRFLDETLEAQALPLLLPLFWLLLTMAFFQTPVLLWLRRQVHRLRSTGGVEALSREFR